MKFDIGKMETTNDKDKGDSKYWSAKEGEHTVRIIENPKSESAPMVIAFKHFNVGPNKRSYWCPKTVTDGSDRREWSVPCPICDQVSGLYDSGEEEDRLLASSIKAKKRILLNVVPLKQQDKGVRVFECASTLFDIMKKYWTSKKWGNLADAKEGYDFVIVRKGSGLKTSYDDSYAVDDPSKIQDIEWQANTHDLASEVAAKSYDSLKTIMETGDDPDEGSAKPKAATPKAEPEKEKEEPTSEPETPAEEEEKPKAKKKKVSKKKPPCFGDFDEDDDDCAECPWVELCEAKADDSGDEADEAPSEDSALEDEILEQLKNQD